VEKSRHLLVKTAQEFGGVSAVIDSTAALGQRLEQLVTAIHTTSREQADGVAQINAAVSQMDLVTQGNAAGAEQNAAAAAELSGEASALAQAVGDLRALIGRPSPAPSSGLLAPAAGPPASTSAAPAVGRRYAARELV
jgi:methyl-accepting chemotaxis protein